MNDTVEHAKVQALDGLVRDLSARPEVTGIFLFGSFARGESRPDSDIDLFVVHTGPFARVIIHRGDVEFEVFFNNEAATVEFWEHHPDDFVRFWDDARVLYDRDGATARLEAAAETIAGYPEWRRS